MAARSLAHRVCIRLRLGVILHACSMPAKSCPCRVQNAARSGHMHGEVPADARHAFNIASRRLSNQPRLITRCKLSHNDGTVATVAPDTPPVDRITSVTNSYIKHCVKLRTSSKYRSEAGRCLLVGRDLLAEATGDAGTLNVRALFVSEHLAQPLKQQQACVHVGRPGSGSFTTGSTTTPYNKAAESTNGILGVALPGIHAQSTIIVSDAVMKKLTGLESVDGVEAVAELDLPPLVDFSKPGLKVRRLLALDGVQDPGNLGTLLRTAIAFGWDGVVLLPGCADPFGDKAVRASRGAALRMAIGKCGLGELQRVVQQQKLLLLAAEPEEQQLPTGSSSSSSSAQHRQQQQQLNGFSGEAGNEGTAQSTSAAASACNGYGISQEGRGVCLVLGSEGQGLSPEVLAACTPVAIPMAGQMESLNVGIAGGILMFILSQGMPQLMGRLDSLLRSDDSMQE